MSKKLIALLSVALVGRAVAANAQLQPWVAPTGSGTPYWDNGSGDGANCNFGYVLTGVAGSPGNPCRNQRPSSWLPVTGLTPVSYLGTAGGQFEPFGVVSGLYNFSLLPGAVPGGDVAGQDVDWGYFTDLVNPGTSRVSFNSATFPTDVTFSNSWGFWIQLTNGNYAYSTSDNQFALAALSDGTYVLGYEDIFTGRGGGSDKDYNDEFVRFQTVDTPQSTVPEPATMSLLAMGLVGMGAVTRRRRKSA